MTNVEEVEQRINKELKTMPTWYWSLRRWFLYVVQLEWRHDIKWWIQRRVKGYDSRDEWNTGFYLANTIVKHLKMFRKMKRHGVPCMFIVKNDDEQLTKGTKKFNAALDKMIQGWEYYSNEDDIRMNVFEKYNKEGEELPPEYLKELTKLEKEARTNANLLTKYLGCIWD